jgi:hypothetical protein
MIIVKATDPYDDEFFGMGETVELALENLAEISEDFEHYQMEFYDAKPITVRKKVSYKIEKERAGE